MASSCKEFEIPGTGGAPKAVTEGVRRVSVIRSAGFGTDTDVVAEEVPVAIVYNGISHVVMMASPLMLEEFAVGFSLDERIVPDLSHIYDIEVRDACHNGKEVHVTISSECFWALKKTKRALEGRTGCGICGVESLKDAVREKHCVPHTQMFDMCHYEKAIKYLSTVEVLGGLTGCTHAAVWVSPDGALMGGAEDVGRHVALDKLLGLRAKNGWKDGALFVSSRASYEMVQKASSCGVEIMFAVSAPTALAIEVADAAGLTLSAFCRDRRLNAYTHAERLMGLTPVN